jgi:hypothetical protein
MWLGAGLAVLTSAAILATPAFGASCAAPGSTTLGTTTTGSTAPVRRHDLRIYRQGNAVWVCSTLYGHRIRLAKNVGPGAYDYGAPPDVRKFAYGLFRRPSTRTFAYAIADGGPRGVFGSRDLKTGALLRGHIVTDVNSVTVRNLVARPDGSIAYIYFASGAYYVEKVDRTGFAALDSTVCPPGSDVIVCRGRIRAIDPDGPLTISGPNVEWMDDGMIQTAPFA